ncbi:hypothetical protein L5515_017056 [Caenorhabditis briggsae]|uniref:Uncharacterized protein n=1 Tax=Caenorhabditis briggsae TaxID=6238 RepID=A0AAE9JS42_CAEBR|nr:hypothetical protein L5515_017056 [Caenorhabditis briggsae]
MDCDGDGMGNCYTVKNASILSVIEDALQPGSPFSAFLLAVEICLCFIFLFSIPNTRKDSIFCFLAIVLAPYLVKTTVEVAYFVSIYFYTASYTFWSWVHDSVVSFCYSSFLFNYQYGLVLYSWQGIYAAIKKRPVSKSKTSSIWPYMLIFMITLIQSAIHWQIMTVGLVSALLILVLAPISIIVSILCVLICKTDHTSMFEMVREIKSRLLWNIPCLVISMADVSAELYLNFRPNAYKTTAVHNKGYLFPILFPPVAIIVLFLTLPALRRAIFPCCYSNETDSDRMFLLRRNTNSSSGSPAPSEQSSITNHPIITYPSNTVVPYNTEPPPFYPYYTMPHVYQPRFGQGYGQHVGQTPGQFCPPENGQPMYFPIPITFYNPSNVPLIRNPNDLPPVQ